MRKHILGSLALVATLIGVNAAVGADLPHRFAPWSLDRGLVTIDNPVDGRTIAVWSYRFAGQYDLAVSFRQTGSALWSEPVFLGTADSLQQEQPSVTVDAAGNYYLAYVVRDTGQILLTTLRPGEETWSAPANVAPGPGRRAFPIVRVIAGSLVVAFRVGSGLDLVELPLLAPVPPVGTHGVQDGPDTNPGNRRMPPPTDSEDGAWRQKN